MPRNRIKVRSRTTGLTAEIAVEALDHFPDYEPIDAAPEAAPVEPDLPPAEAAETKPTKSSKAADK